MPIPPPDVPRCPFARPIYKYAETVGTTTTTTTTTIPPRTAVPVPAAERRLSDGYGERLGQHARRFRRARITKKRVTRNCQLARDISKPNVVVSAHVIVMISEHQRVRIFIGIVRPADTFVQPIVRSETAANARQIYDPSGHYRTLEHRCRVVPPSYVGFPVRRWNATVQSYHGRRSVWPTVVWETRVLNTFSRGNRRKCRWHDRGPSSRPPNRKGSQIKKLPEETRRVFHFVFFIFRLVCSQEVSCFRVFENYFTP